MPKNEARVVLWSMQRKDIEARIDELRSAPYLGRFEVWKKERIANLERELKAWNAMFEEASDAKQD